MSEAVINIRVATLTDVPEGASRIDGVPNQLVTLQSMGAGATHEMSFFDVTNPLVSGSSSTAPSVPTLTAGGDGRTWTFTPPGGASAYGQSFGIELVVDRGLESETRSRRKYAIPTSAQGLVLPLFGEGADREASLSNHGNVQVANSVDNASGNWRGFHPRLLRAFLADELYNGRIYLSPNPNNGTGTTLVLVGAVSLPRGTLVEIAADLGDAADATEPAIITIRTQGGSPSTIATATVTHLRAWTYSAQAVVVAAETPCDVLVHSTNPSGSWICDAIRLTMRAP